MKVKSLKLCSDDYEMIVWGDLRILKNMMYMNFITIVVISIINRSGLDSSEYAKQENLSVEILPLTISLMFLRKEQKRLKKYELQMIDSDILNSLNRIFFPHTLPRKLLRRRL